MFKFMFKHTTRLRIDKANSIITSYFAQFVTSGADKVLVGKPTYKWLINKTVIQIPYFVGGKATDRLEKSNSSQGDMESMLAETKINALGSALALILGLGKASSTQCEVRFIRLRYPYLNSQILSQFLAINAGKYNFTRLQKGLFNQVPTITCEDVFSTNSLLPAWHSQVDVEGNLIRDILYNPLFTQSATTGIELELAGRLTTQRNIPRKTVNSTRTGSLSTTSVNNSMNYSLDFSQYTTKNKLGTYTVKVWLSNVTPTR